MQSHHHSTSRLLGLPAETPPDEGYFYIVLEYSCLFINLLSNYNSSKMKAGVRDIIKFKRGAVQYILINEKNNNIFH